MLRSRCASLRQLLRQSRLASGSCSWLSFTPIAARPLRPLSSRIFLPVVFESSRPFSVTPKVAAKRLEHFSKDLYEGIVEGTLEGILESLELLAETRPEVDVEYSAGVMTIKAPQGTYVLNKQPPNRQLWLSSPVSGPKRYDWDHVRMYWIDTRDGSTLNALMRDELGVEYDISLPIEG